MGKQKQIRVGCMFWNYLADRTQQLVKQLWDIFEEMGISAKFYLGTENHFYMNEVMAEGSKYDYQYSCLSAYSRYERFDLLIISGGTLTISRSREEAERILEMLPDVPKIFLENSRDDRKSRSLILDNEGGIRQCTEHLIMEHHCKRIAFISGPRENISAQERKKAFYETMESHGLTVLEEDFVQGNYGESVDELVEPLFGENGHPDAIVSANDEMALAVYRVTKKHGLTIGKDILLTGFDDISVAPYLDPPLTTVRQDYQEMAREIVELGMKMLNGNMPESAVYHPKMMIRSSCGCARCQNAEPVSVTETEHNKLVSSFVELRNMRQRILSGATMNRAMLNARDRSSYVSMVSSMMQIENLQSGRMLLLNPSKVLKREDVFMLPPEIDVAMLCINGIGKTYREEDMPKLLLDCPENCPETDGPAGCSAVFLLFFEEYQYGVLELKIRYEEIEHYYMLSLEIGLGLRYLDLLKAEEAARTELEDKNRKLDFAAYHDALTTVFNRNGFLQQEREVIRRYAGKPVAVLMADLDHLKQINDTYGHAEGDRAIRLTAEALREVLGDFAPIIGRTGGDEFSAIFSVADDFDAQECVEKIHRYCDEFNRTSDLPYYLGISTGCLKFTAKENMKLRELFADADVLLYADKKRRRLMVIKESEKKT
ncbi:MAG: GGDEF domain-containing protein [Lachnospiraceae bacterium]|nr:GGDEF domain-containing protein [Lachnospiraceae bacterium]